MTSKSAILKIIKEKCKEDCCTGDKESWINCSIEKCVLFPFRMGKDPKTSSIRYQPKENRVAEHRPEHQKQVKIAIVEGDLGEKNED